MFKLQREPRDVCNLGLMGSKLSPDRITRHLTEEETVGGIDESPLKLKQTLLDLLAHLAELNPAPPESNATAFDAPCALRASRCVYPQLANELTQHSVFTQAI